MSVGSKFNKYGTAPPGISDEVAENAFNYMLTQFEGTDFDKTDINMISKEDLIVRFLIARKYDQELSSEMLRNYLLWRTDKNVNGVFGESFPDSIPRLYPCSFCGKDNDGHVIYMEQPNQSSIKELMKLHDMDVLLRWHVYCMERIRERNKFEHTDRISVILDLSGIGISVLADMKAISFLKTLASTDQQYYPENMRRLFVINAPSVFTGLWKIVKPLLDERTQRKVQVLGKDYLTVMQEFISIDQIPECVGGQGKLTVLSHDTAAYTLAPLSPSKKS